MITDWFAWWKGVQRIVSPVRRDFYVWLAFSGCRAGESMSMELKNIDLKKGVVMLARFALRLATPVPELFHRSAMWPGARWPWHRGIPGGPAVSPAGNLLS